MPEQPWVPTIDDLRVRVISVSPFPFMHADVVDRLLWPAPLTGQALLHLSGGGAVRQSVSSLSLFFAHSFPVSAFARTRSFSEAEDPPRAWTHPCSCTLVAHESCLLEWITSAQQDSARVKNALKCPQCGSKYELESDNPTSLRILNALNASISSFGKVGTVVGAAGLAASFSFSTCYRSSLRCSQD